MSLDHRIYTPPMIYITRHNYKIYQNLRQIGETPPHYHKDNDCTLLYLDYRKYNPDRVIARNTAFVELDESEKPSLEEKGFKACSTCYDERGSINDLF